MCNKIGTFVLIGVLTCIPTSFSLAFPPFRTEGAGTTPKGGIGIELGNEFIHTEDGKQNFIGLNLIYGIANWIEMDVNFALLYLRPDSGEDKAGFADILILSKVKILEENGIFGQQD